jgi:hypothetical protein
VAIVSKKSANKPEPVQEVIIEEKEVERRPQPPQQPKSVAGNPNNNVPAGKKEPNPNNNVPAGKKEAKNEKDTRLTLKASD